MDQPIVPSRADEGEALTFLDGVEYDGPHRAGLVNTLLAAARRISRGEIDDGIMLARLTLDAREGVVERVAPGIEIVVDIGKVPSSHVKDIAAGIRELVNPRGYLLVVIEPLIVAGDGPLAVNELKIHDWPADAQRELWAVVARHASESQIRETIAMTRSIAQGREEVASADAMIEPTMKLFGVNENDALQIVGRVLEVRTSKRVQEVA
jgi:hypothetical protein